MTLSGTHRKMSLVEFSAMIAYMISIVALSIDAMLPVMDTIGHDLGVFDPKRTELIIGALFFGLASGQMIYGPLSDTIGRQRSIFIGIIIFSIGCLISIFAKDFSLHIFGRVLQGLGAASPRIVSMAIIRDRYEGREMAKVASIIMGFFIVVPAIAPALGQWIADLWNWKAIYYVLLLMALANFCWYATRLGETLHPEYRRPFDLKSIASAIVEIVHTRISLGYTLAAGVVYGGFYLYLSTSSHLFKTAFGIDENFPYYFGGLALAIGAASIVNSRLVMRLGIRRLINTALRSQVFISILFFTYTIWQGGDISIIPFMVWAALTFFTMGIMFGNINAIALEPLGHIAGIGAAFVGAVTTFLSLGLGTTASHVFGESAMALIGTFALFGLLSILILYWAESGHKT